MFQRIYPFHLLAGRSGSFGFIRLSAADSGSVSESLADSYSSVSDSVPVSDGESGSSVSLSLLLLGFNVCVVLSTLVVSSVTFCGVAARCRASKQVNNFLCRDGRIGSQFSPGSAMRIVVRKRQSCSTDWSVAAVSRRWDKVSAQFVIQSSGTPGISLLKTAAISLTLFNFWRLVVSPLSSSPWTGRLNSSTDN